ncbi:unnamed protein product [marine sediment metagenome]|uniref:Uncharacterized protein n=1 Tax=marine sediment metagenome TaxID=412755 RepID=X0X6J8_9ZZZZ
MEPIRKKLSSLLIKAANKKLKALDPQSQCAKKLAEIENVDTIVVEEIEKICKVATLGEITRFFLLVARLKTTSEQKREAIKGDIKKIAKKLVSRVESESGTLRLPQSCFHILLGI